MNALLARLLPGLLGGVDAGVRRLAQILEISPAETAALGDNPRLAYRSFAIRKRLGGTRQICAPSDPLKRLQRRLLRHYLEKLPIHEAATAYHPAATTIAHARRHLGQALVLTVDLADFFPSTSTRRVRQWFREAGWSGAALHGLLRLCTYRGGLPQGAPTSPVLSNLVNLVLDRRLSELAALHQARYSRYADDLVFSWSEEAEPLGFRIAVAEILATVGYQIQPAKGWRVQHAEQHPEVTGLVLDRHRLRLPERILLKIRELQRRWLGRSLAHDQQLQGYLGLLRMLKTKAKRFRRRQK